MIAPTIGRKVWFTPLQASDSRFDDTQPLDATVVYVWNERLVNLAVRDQTGNAFAVTSVPLLQDHDQPCETGYYAEWMPFQKGQAVKQEEAKA